MQLEKGGGRIHVVEVHTFNSFLVATVILELKSISRIREDWIPYPNHVLQLQAYLWMLDRPRGFIVYIEKSRGRIYPIEVEREASAWALIIQRARILHHHLLNNEPPRPEPSSLCRVCDYRRFCGHEGGSKALY